MSGTLLKQKTITNKRKLKPQMHINRIYAMHVWQAFKSKLSERQNVKI